MCVSGVSAYSPLHTTFKCECVTHVFDVCVSDASFLAN